MVGNDGSGDGELGTCRSGSGKLAGVNLTVSGHRQSPLATLRSLAGVERENKETQQCELLASYEAVMMRLEGEGAVRLRSMDDSWGGASVCLPRPKQRR